MAASVATSNDDLLAFGSLSRDIQESTTGSDDAQHDGLSSQDEIKPRELWKPHLQPARDPAQTRSHEPSIRDLPPDHIVTDAYAVAYIDADRHGPLRPDTGSEKLDLSSIDGIRSYANKKAKKAAKQAQMNKWANDDDDEKKEEGAEGAEEGDGGGDGGAGAGGDGGDGGDPPGGDGNGDDNPDDWGFGGGKKSKKKKKKNAWEEFEEEEKRREEEEAKQAEEAAANGDALPAAEVDPADEWGSFAPAGGKKKKGKKGKVEPEPDPEPPAAMETVDLAAGASADAPAEANAEDEWGGFSTGKKKKGKKGKNEPAPSATPAAPENEMKFDDVNLSDDKTAPKLADLDFGGGAADDKPNGFSFGGGWGSGWGSGGGSGGGSTWGFGGADVAAEKKDEAADIWAFPTTKKDKKKKGNTFDFGFDDVGGDTNGDSAAAGDLASPLTEEKPPEDDPWSFTTTTSKKDKKKKKGAAVIEPEVIDVPPPPSPAPAEEKPDDDPWAAFGAVAGSKKDKKKKKGLAAFDPAPEPEAEPEPVIVPEPEPVAEEKPAEDDFFGGWGMSAKDKKKAKKAAKGKTEDPPAVVDLPEPPPAEPEVEVSPPPAAPEEPSADIWGFGMSAKDKKKAKKAGKAGKVEDKPLEELLVVEAPPPPPAVPEPATDATDDWFGGWGTTSKKDKKKKGKGEPEPPPPAPEPAVPAADELQPDGVDEPKANDDWLNSWTTGTKKKAGKKDKIKGIVEVSDPPSGASLLQPDSVQEKSAEEDPWSSMGNVGKKDKKKAKKGALGAMSSPPAEEPLPEDAIVDVPPPALVDTGEPAANDDPWASFSTGKKDKKSKKGSKAEEATLTKTKSKDSKSSQKEGPNDIVPILDEEVPAPEPEPEPEPAKEEKSEKRSPKATSSGWGSLWGSGKTTTKSTKEKEREKEKEKETKAKEKAEKEEAEKAAAEQAAADEAAFAAALGDDPDEVLEVVDEAPAKKSSSKDKKKSKKAAKEEPPVQTIDESAAADPTLDGVDETAAETDVGGAAAGWGFWGLKGSSTKKATAAKEEIGKGALASPGAALTGKPKKPDVTSPDALEPEESATVPETSKSAKESSSSKLKSAKGSSVKDRIKALQGEKDAAKKAAAAPPVPDSIPLAEPEPAPEPPLDELEPMAVVPPSPEEKRSKSSKAKTKGKKESTLLPVESAPGPPPPASPLPGGFPTDDLLDWRPTETPAEEMLSPPPPKTSKKDKSSKSKKGAKPEPAVEVPEPPLEGDDLLMDEPLPTPPPEKPAKESKESSRGQKKERPKVVRDQGSSSWGFWAATPPPKSGSKDKSRSKDGSTSPIKERPGGMSRSKSSRKASERDPLEKGSKSSGSDKDVKTSSRSRPGTFRGTSFGAMFGMGSTPVRSKSTRERPSASRRHSIAVDDHGMISPPPEDVGAREMSAKAAKLMGVSRSKSTREKRPGRVPDPYALDSDDMVMADAPEDSAKDVPPAEPNPERKEKKSRRSRHWSAFMSGGLGEADDTIMADAPRGSYDRADDLTFDTRPPLVRRATSNAKKGGLMGGLLGALGARPTPDRRQSKIYDSEDAMSRRKRGTVYDEDQSKRLRREDRKVNRSRKLSDADGFDDAVPTIEAEEVAAQEARDARRAERRARREREATEEAARAQRRHEREEARRAKAQEEAERVRQEDEEREARRQEQRRARRAERDERRAEEDRIAQEEEVKAAERRERRRERDRQRNGEDDEVTPRPKAERRRSHMDGPEDEEARRMRRDERRMRRSNDPSSGQDKERPRISRRRSDHPAPVADYFDKRNGERSPRADGVATAPLADGPPLKATGGDKTASWVHSLHEDPPPPPPVEGTIVDAPVHFADADPLDETTAREMRHRRHRDRDGYSEHGSDRTRRRREKQDRDAVKSTSDGSSHDRHRGGPVNSLGYDEMGAKAFDGRPAMPTGAAKRGSWLKKIAGL